MRTHQRVLMGVSLLVTALLMAQLHLAMNHIQYLDEKLGRVSASLEKLRQQQAASSMPRPNASLVPAIENMAPTSASAKAVENHLPKVDSASASLQKLRQQFAASMHRPSVSLVPARPTSAAAKAVQNLGTIAKDDTMLRGDNLDSAEHGVVPGRARTTASAVRPGATPVLRTAQPAGKGIISAAQECEGSPEQEPRIHWEGVVADFGPPVNDHLVRMGAGEAVNAGDQYIKWERWQWKQRCGDKLARVGARVKEGADRSRIKYVRIWGERNSCTTMVTDILSRNLDLKCDGSASCVSGGLPHKHDFMRGANLHDHGETLNVGSFFFCCRSASMHPLLRSPAPEEDALKQTKSLDVCTPFSRSLSPGTRTSGLRPCAATLSTPGHTTTKP